MNFIAGTGGAPMPTGFTPDDSIGPFAEPYAGRDLPAYNSPPDPAYNLTLPLVAPESAPQPFEFGYVVVEVHGSKIIATYKSEPAAGAGFLSVESWIVQGAILPGESAQGAARTESRKSNEKTVSSYILK